jgi:hypothetical protein
MVVWRGRSKMVGGSAGSACSSVDSVVDAEVRVEEEDDGDEAPEEK